MNYSETTAFLFNKLTSFQLSGRSAYKPGLETTLVIDNKLGNPHLSYITIHVAGTNGKGSVSHMLASILQEAGYRVGLFTSPHLRDFRERIRVDGNMISEQEVVDFVRENMEIINRLSPSFFEISTAMALMHFKTAGVEVAVIETGLGGRLDSTNIIIPAVSVITNIGLDHTDLLGDTIEKIALEKAGIIKQKVPVVIGKSQVETQKVFIEKAKQMESEIVFADKIYSCDYSMLSLDNKQIFNIRKENQMVWEGLQSDLLGLYQRENILTVIAAMDMISEKLKIEKAAVYSGISRVSKNTGLSGRWQVLSQSPLTVCDSGHNTDGIKMILDQIKNTAHKSLHFVFGVVSDKNIEGILSLLPKNACYYFTKAAIPRALNEQILMEKAQDYGLSGTSYPTVKSAIEAAKKTAQKDDMIFIGGSTFVVAEV